MGVKKKRAISFFLNKAIRHLTARKTVTFAEPISEFYEEDEFNAPEFEEYDSTPYDNGYDPCLTYGKPLKPSDSTCYPTSAFDPSCSPSSVLEGFTYASIPSPYGEDKVDLMRNPQNGSPPNDPHKVEEEEKPGGGGNGGNGSLVSEPESYSENLRGENKFSNGFGDGKAVGSFPDVGLKEKENLQSGFGCGYGREDDNYNYEKQVPQPPCPDDVGPYAVLAGYFPCLFKKDKKTYVKQDVSAQSCGIQWRGTEEYLFGNLYPYTERRIDDVSYGYPGYRYERHYPRQPHDVQIEYNEEPHYARVEYNEMPNYVQAGRRVDNVSYAYPGYCYERHYLEQPHNVQIEYNEEPHHAQIEYNEMPNYVQAEIKVDDVSYGYPGYCYGRHYPEQPRDVQIEYNQEPHYAQVEYNEMPNYVQADHYEQLWSQNQQYSVTYPVEYNEEPSYVRVEHNEQLSSQNAAYSKAYQEEYYHPFNHDDDSFNSRYFHYNQFEYAVQ